jgi:hypothetical protein
MLNPRLGFASHPCRESVEKQPKSIVNFTAFFTLFEQKVQVALVSGRYSKQLPPLFSEEAVVVRTLANDAEFISWLPVSFCL